MTTHIFLDTETFCPVPINNGTFAYAEQAEVMIIVYAVNDGPVKILDLTNPTPELEKEMIHFRSWINTRGARFVIHNSQFDRAVLKYGNLKIDLPVERVVDTMVMAHAHGLPGSLGVLGDVFRLSSDKTKDKRGHQLIQLFCKPQAATRKVERATRDTHPKEWAEFLQYAAQDIEAMREFHKRLPSWNYPGMEYPLWCLDQRINFRGFAVDRDLARTAIDAVRVEQDRLAARTLEHTSGAVTSATKRNDLLAHILGEYGVSLPDMQAATLERRLTDPDLPDGVRELIGLRLSSTTSSTAKYKALARGVSSDGRLRGTLQFCGASRTGRWSGRTFQPQNLPRPTMKQEEIDYAIQAFKLEAADVLLDDVMAAASSAIRGCIVAPAGRKLVVADLANIEGRVAAWLSGESWKLAAFEAYDRKTGADLYKLAYARAFDVTPDSVSKDQRQIGKVMELMLQYEGGVGAFITGAATYGIDLDALAVVARSSIPGGIWMEAESLWNWASKQKRTFGLARETYIVCDSLKRMWREAQPRIAASWSQIQEAALRAVQGSSASQWGKLQFRRDGSWLRVILPSGRSLCYASPRVEDGKLSYMGINQYSRKWERLGTYGGKLFENIVQAVARDIMASAMPVIELKGYEIVLSVHDEILTETPDTNDFSCDELERIMSTPPEWASGLPLAASGFETTRYRKD